MTVDNYFYKVVIHSYRFSQSAYSQILFFFNVYWQVHLLIDCVRRGGVFIYIYIYVGVGTECTCSLGKVLYIHSNSSPRVEGRIIIPPLLRRGGMIFSLIEEKFNMFRFYGQKIFLWAKPFFLGKKFLGITKIYQKKIFTIFVGEV